MNLKTFEELKLSGNLPSPAGVGMKILQITRTEDYSADEMGEAIMADSSLTGRILKLANSASNAGREPATSVSEAIMRLGSRTVRDLALAFSLVSERRAGTCRAFDYSGYWARSLARAVSAQVLSRVTEFGKPETAYICGLLGEIGRLALASVYAEQYAQLLDSVVEDDPEVMLEREESQFNINHAQVAACMLNDWGLPDAFSEAIESFCCTRQLGTEKQKGFESFAMLLRFGHVIAEVCMAGEDTRYREWARMGDSLELLRGRLGMDEQPFTRLCDTCVNEWTAWGESLDIETIEGVKFSVAFQRIENARQAIAEGREERPDKKARSARPAEVDDGVEAKERFKILAVDDDPVSLKLLVRHLEGEGYDVEVARNGKEGLKVALSTTPDIVIADWEMPDFDGLELCRSLRKTDAGANMYFLLLTGRTEDDLLVEAFDSGVDEFVTKPFSPKLLFARIKGGIRLARLQRKIESDKQTMMKQVAELGVLTRKLRAASLTDPLTELPNRRYAMKRLESEWASVQRTKRPMSIMMIDIDNFKAVNDNYGHDVGDIVLKETATILQDAIRTVDEVCRMGGEEFLIICKNTNEDECMIVAERVRAAVEAHVVSEPLFHKSVTVSLGVACTDLGSVDIGELYKAADEAVYLAKESGRNCSRRATELNAARKSA